MRNLRFVPIMIMALLFSGSVFAQKHISNYFVLEKEIAMKDIFGSNYSGRFNAAMAGDRIFICPNKIGRVKKQKVFDLPVWVVDLKTDKTTCIHLILPPDNQSIFGSKTYWIYGLDIAGDHVLVSTQHVAFDFKNDGKGKYELVKQTRGKGYEFSFNFATVMDTTTYFCSTIHDYGYKLQSQTPASSTLDSVADFVLPASFLEQFGPNGFIKYADKHIYFLPVPKPILQKYDLQGNLVGEVKLDIPGWNDMPAGYQDELSSMEYGGDRAMHIYYTSNDYSWLLEVMPLNDEVFKVVYHKPRIDDKKSSSHQPLMCFIDKDWTSVRLEACVETYDQDFRYADNEFPMQYYGISIVMTLYGNNRVVQFVKTSPVDWRGKTISEYAKAEDEYFKDHDPILKVRVMKLKDEYCK